MLGAGKTVIESLRNAQTSTFRGIANTYEAAKEGGFSGAVEHIASHIPVVNNLVDAHKGGNILSIMYLLVLFSVLILTGLLAIFTMTTLRKCTLLQIPIMKGINIHA